jgi:hypothetical protein
MPEDLLVYRRPSEAREMVAQIFTSWNPLTSWLRGVDELRNVS